MELSPRGVTGDYTEVVYARITPKETNKASVVGALLHNPPPLI